MNGGRAANAAGEPSVNIRSAQAALDIQTSRLCTQSCPLSSLSSFQGVVLFYKARSVVTGIPCITLKFSFFSPIYSLDEKEKLTI